MKTSFAAVELELQDGKVDVHQENFLSAKSKYCSWLEVLHTRHKRAIADPAQTGYCSTFHCSSVRVFVCHRRDISTFLNYLMI